MALRQEVLNVLLAELLQERGLVAVPEQVLKQPLKSVSLPDVIVDCQGLRLAIEAEFAMNAAAQKAAYESARERVEQAIAHVGIAIVYPKKLRSVSFDKAKSALETSKLQYAIVTEAGVTHPQMQLLLFPLTEEAPEFSVGTVNDLADLLHRSYEQLVKDETLDQAVNLLEMSIGSFLTLLQIQPATTGRLASALSVEPPDKKSMGTNQRNAANRISALILVNAMIFQEVLARQEPKVKPLQSIRARSDHVSALVDHWHFILDKINYYPIFHTACELLECLTADVTTDRAITNLVDAALKVVSWRASLRHDLAGRIYHRLLEEAKYLGAYYTSIPAATLLLKLALRPDRYECEWWDLESIGGLKIGDLACGTGTLLMAAADVIVDNHVRACVQKGTKPDLQKLHKNIVEKVIYGYDVLPSAVHLTASTLTLRNPDSPTDVTHLYRVPLGGHHNLLGSLEFIENESINGTLFGQQPEQITGKKAMKKSIVLPNLDLCTMNPPFTSSRQPNLLFGNVIGREELQKRLRSIVKTQKLPTSITAGLGAVFVALADKNLKPNGRVAFVLPRSVLNGVAWQKTRERIARDYILEYIIVSHEPNRWNFSENTDLSEAMIVARKESSEASGHNQSVVCVNFWRQPRTAVEALNVAGFLTESSVPEVESEQGCLQLKIGSRKLGEAISVQWTRLKNSSWNFPCAFAQSELVRIFYQLLHGKIYLPGEGKAGNVALTALSNLADLGPDPRDVYDGFDLVEGKSPYPSFWGHDAEAVRKIQQSPNQYLTPVSKPKPGRHLRKVTDLWPKAARVLIAQRPRMNTKSVIAIRVSEKVLGDVWCPVVLKHSSSDTEKALTIWLNCTLGLLLLLGHREETQGAWIQFKKPELQAMPILDLINIGQRKLKKLAAIYDQFADRKLEPFPNMVTDHVRDEIDKAVAKALHIPDISILRNLLGREPVICVTLDRLS